MKILVTLCLFLCIALTGLSQVYEVPLSSKAAAAITIVEGEVISQFSFWDDKNHNIYTSNKVKVFKELKGAITNPTIEVITLGGTIGMEKQTVKPSLQLGIGDIGVFFLKPNTVATNTVLFQSEYQTQPYSGPQGFIKYDPINGKANSPFHVYTNPEEEVLGHIRAATHTNPTSLAKYDFSDDVDKWAAKGGTSISNFTPGIATAGTASIITITGSGFGASAGTVRFSNADDGGATFTDGLATEIISWNDAEIIVEVNQEAGTGPIQVVGLGTATSASALTITYAQLNANFDPGSGMEAYQTRHVNRNSNGGYIWQMHTDFEASAANASFVRSLDSWRCSTGIYWEIGAVTSTDVVANDNVNIIRFDNGSELPTGVLGRCTSRWSGCGGATIEWYVEELDIVFDDGTNWNFTTSAPGFSQYDFETVSVHELGHGHQLGHVIDGSDIMYFSVSNGQQERTLNANNLAGASDVQSRSTGGSVCSQTVISSYSCLVCDAPTASATAVASCAAGSNGTVTVNTTGGAGTFTYSLDGGTPQASNVFTGLSAATYNITVIVDGDLACTASTSATVSVFGAASITGATEVYVGSSITLTGNGTAATVDPWVSSNTGIATVDTSGEVTGVSVGSTVITYTTDGGCTAQHTVTINTAPIHWNGSVSTDWNNSGNWSSAAVPSALDNVVIPSAPSNQPHVTLAPGTPAVCADLTIESGATLTVDAGKALTASGATANAGTILVKADATGIGSLITEGTITGAGAFQMEQYLTGSGGATPDGLFYYVSSPTTNATSSVYNAVGTDKLWSADETTQSYPEITNNSTSLNVVKGYAIRLGVTGTKTFTGGAFNTGNKSASGLSRTGITELNRGYNLVGNPYPSTVSWDDVDTTNLYGTIWYRTHQNSTMLYDTYNAVSGLGTNNNLLGAVTGDIPPTQAFWVRVKNDESTASVNFTNAMRSHGTLSGIYRMAAEEGTVRMSLSNGAASDEAILLFNQEATDDFDAYDSHKFWAAASIPQIYLNEATDTIAINGLYSTATNPIVDLGVKLPTAGDYTLNASEITVVGETVYLEDRMLSIFQDLNAEPTYAFSSSVAGNIPTRFALHFGMAITGVVDGSTINSHVYTSNGNQLNIILSGNTEAGNVQVLDMAGRVVFVSGLNSTRNMLELNVNAGIYLVQVATATGTDTHRVILN